MRADYATIDVAKYIKLNRIKLVNGDLTTGVIITKQFAEKNYLSIGDSLPIETYGISSLEPLATDIYQVLAIIPETLYFGDVYIDWSSTIAQQAPPILAKSWWKRQIQN